jgi:hypothetical protein
MPPEQAEERVVRAKATDASGLVALTKNIVEQVSGMLTEAEEVVRSLSQGKGE